MIYDVLDKTWTELYITAGTTVLLIIITFAQRYLVRCLQLAMLCFILVYHIARVFLINEYWIYPAKSRVFFLGYGLATLQSILILRLYRVSHKVLATALALVLRFAYITGYLEPGSFVLSSFIKQLLIDGFIIHTVYTYEKVFRKIYLNFVQQKEELLKFKELLAESLPISLIVVSYKENELLFSNNAFQSFIGDPNNSDCSVGENSLKSTLESLVIDQSTIRETGTDIVCWTYLDDSEDVTSLKEVLERMISKEYLDRKAISLTASLTRNQKKKSFEITLKKVKWDAQHAIAIIFNDITYQERLIALKSSNINKDKVIATISHELRTPLNGIIGFLDIVEKKVEDPEIAYYLSLSKDNAYLLLNHINSILDLQQISTGKLRLNLAKVDIRTCINNIAQLFRFQCKHKNISLESSVDKDVPTYIFTDENRLKQILINLVGNSIKFTSKGEVKINVTLEEKNPAYLLMSVADTGIGIKQEDTKHLFKMFSKIEDKESVNKNGVGLGLTVSNALAILLANNLDSRGLEVETEYGSGSKFFFRISKNLKQKTLQEIRMDRIHNFEKIAIPAISNAQEETSMSGILEQRETKQENADIVEEYDGDEFEDIQQKDLDEFFSYGDLKVRIKHYTLAKKANNDSPTILQSEDQHKSRQKPKTQENDSSEKPASDFYILIVDDNPFNLLVATNFVQECGYKVKTALSGQEAIDIVENSYSQGITFKAIFMDCQMPIMDGFETTKVLKAKMKNKEISETSIFAWTANNSEEDVKRCYEAGMIGYLPKPASKLDIIKILSDL